MQNKIFKTLMLAIFAMLSLSASAQNSRAYIRDAIKGWGECRNVAITKTNGDLALYGTNGYSFKNLPDQLASTIKELHAQEKFIDDIQLTENGRWLVLYGTNGIKWSASLPQDLKDKLIEWNRDQRTITSVTFNDNNEWIAVCTDYISASSTELLNWLTDGGEKYGVLWACCLTDDACVAVYESGYKFRGNVPDDLRDSLRETELDVYRLKIAGSSWFYADKDGNYAYNM